MSTFDKGGGRWNALRAGAAEWSVPDDIGFETTVRATEHGAVVVALAGELDLVTVDRLRSRFDPLRVGDPSTVVVDLRGLTFVDSSGLNMLVICIRAVERNGGSVVVAGANEHIAGLFEVVRFPDTVTVAPSFDAALEQAERTASART